MWKKTSTPLNDINKKRFLVLTVIHNKVDCLCQFVLNNKKEDGIYLQQKMLSNEKKFSRKTMKVTIL